ncbi:MAG: acyl carrier protein [Anaerolineaceae bacterium]|jgi:acyl carrier protein
MKTFEEIYTIVIDVLNYIQECDGAPQIELSGDTCPMVDLPGFDSIHWVETIVLISDKLGKEINEKALFGTPEKFNKITVHEITLRILENLSDREEHKDER